MEDKILKQIEEEALRRFPEPKLEIKSLSFQHDSFIRRNANIKSFKEGAKWFRDNQVNAKLVEALKNIALCCDNQNETHEVIWRIAHESLLSASQNTVSKSAPSQVIEEAMKAASINVRVPSVIRNGEVSPLNTESNEWEKEEYDTHLLYHECIECNSRCNCNDIECSCCNELVSPTLSQLNSTEEGRLVLAALIKITTESETDKTPYQVLEQLKVIASELINPTKEK